MVQWHRGLVVNQDKMEMVIFTRKYKVPKVKEPKFYGNDITVSDSVKYRGVMLDEKLSWKEHLELQYKKFCIAFRSCRRILEQPEG